MSFNLNSFPRYYSFITYRPERFGALVFNPCTSSELELSIDEAYIAELFCGRSNINELILRSQHKFVLPFFDAKEKVLAVIKKADGIGALKFHETQQPSIEIKNAASKPADSSAPFYTAPKNAIWDITYLCNLKCPHCLTSSGSRRSGELSTEEACRLIDNLAAARLLYLSFSGGEPFLRPDLSELIRYASKKNIRTDIASNGVEISDEILKKTRDLPLFHVQVSIDGIGESHDAFRGRKGAFASILKNVKRLKEEGISVSVSTTATAENSEQVPAIIDLAAEMGCSSYKAIPFLPAGRGKENAHLVLNPRDYLTLCKTLVEKSKEYAGRMNISSETTFAFLLAGQPAEDIQEAHMGCSAGHDTLSIGSDGTAYPCPFLQELPLGNLLDIPLGDLWKSSPVLKELRDIQKGNMDMPCRECKYAPSHCRGGCRASALFKTGSLRGCDPMCPR